mmetsp:Transcript_7209/g.13699  ORF Transcript_7209/g.13699 Transcript_7209/m.13699 type:complete len:111 (-) Transcript_7209:212-544(-)
MSNFAKRLGKLKHTINHRVDDLPTTNQNNKRRKHGTGHHDNPMTEATAADIGTPKMLSLSRPPRDFQDLSVKVSFLCIGAQKSGTTYSRQFQTKLDNVLFSLLRLMIYSC